MERRRPPVLGSLLQVIPAVQVQRRAPWSVTLVSLERWDTCGVVSFDVLRDGPIDRPTWLRSWLVVEAVDDRGRRYDPSLGGGYGGGSRDGGDHHRLVVKLTPPLDESATELQFVARLQLTRQEDGYPPRQVVAWEDPEPWVFSVALTGPTRRAGGDEPSAATPRPIGAAPPDRPPELRRLRDVIPVVQTQEDAGWSITGVAVERYDDGFCLVYRLRGAEKGPSNPELKLLVSDDLGNDYATWGGGGNGEPETAACHLRLSTVGAPAIDRRSRELRIAIAEVRSTTVEPDAAHPGMGRLVVSGTDQGDWRFRIPLR